MAAPEQTGANAKTVERVRRMKADYVIEPTNLVERFKQRRAERWLVQFSVGSIASTLYDTRPQSEAARAKWRLWRAVTRGDEPQPESPQVAEWLGVWPFD
jgi:hypothetical protein